MRLALFAGLSIALALNATPAAAQYAFITVDAPDANFGTFIYGLNDAEAMVGRAQYNTDAGLSGGSFSYAAGTFAPIDVLGSSPGSTDAYGINNAGSISGSYQNQPSIGVRGFIDTPDGLQLVDVPGARSTDVFRTNELGAAVGNYETTAEPSRGFLLDGGALTIIEVPGAIGYTNAYDINDSGVIVGSYGAADNGVRGFILADGLFTYIDVPDATRTYVTGINNAGTIAGHYATAGGGIRGFVYQDGVFTTIVHPDAPAATFIYDINNNGSLAGFYNDGEGYNQDTHGFIARLGTAVPEPSTWAVLILGFFMGGASLRRRQSAFA